MTENVTGAAPLLVLAVGNPSRGDDALGPALLARLEVALAREVAAGEVALLEDFQLQIEHALDVHGRARVLFVDACVPEAQREPALLRRVAPSREGPAHSHALAPEAVLALCERLYERAPEAWVLALRGERFELGEGLSPAALEALERGLALVLARFEPGVRLRASGRVQGVGLRPYVLRAARALGLRGVVRNSAEGVVVEAWGPAAARASLREALASAPAPASLRALDEEPLAPRWELDGFAVLASPEGSAGCALAPDLAVCEGCLAELRDPSSRRYGYAFTTCVACGPRYALARALPFERARTAMDAFSPCAACRAEYEGGDARRHGAETLSCPACGPTLWLEGPDGARLASDDPVEEAARALRRGALVAVQGLGGVHLLCDATSEEAVRTLRARKGRPARPLAVLVRDLDEAARYARLDEPTRVALASPARPIALAPAREGGPLAGAALRGPSRELGLLLPYTPLHARLVERAGVPLVCTSANRSGEPVVRTHDEARAALAGVADLLLLHHREVVRRSEDSLVRGATVLRRARGLAPAPVRLARAAREPLLAVGAQGKSAACVVLGDEAYLTPHLGDLASYASERAFVEEVEGFERLLGVRAAVLAHDLHPAYASTRYALERGASRRRIAVQHHHAHALAAAVEHAVDPRDTAYAWVLDGGGLGVDGALWGAELLRLEGAGYERLATLRPLPLLGGERALRDVWRQGFALLCELYGLDEALARAGRYACFAELPAGALAEQAALLRSRAPLLRAHGVGRYFDALGALLLGHPRALFEGHVAMALEAAADDALAVTAGPFEVRCEGALAVLDVRPALRALLDDALAGGSVARAAAGVHATLVAACVHATPRDARPVLLTGGALQNATLAALFARSLGARARFATLVPCNDGGVALGQAWYAALVCATP